MNKFSLKTFKNFLSSVDIISFDIFDTAIIRSVNKPTDLFFLVREELSKNGITFPSDLDFRSARIDAEKRARNNAWSERGAFEVSISEIIDELLKNILYIPLSSKKKLIDIEIGLEKIFCIQNPTIFNAYKIALQNKKQIIFTSDMYLPYQVISDILLASDYQFKSQNLYLSSKTSLTKSSGKLFKLILEEFNISPSRILHIGDNIESDYHIPLKNGLKALYYRRLQDRTHDFMPLPTHAQRIKSLSDKDQFIDSFFHAIISLHSARSTSKQNYFYNFGYNCAGPLIISFVSWLSKEFIKDQIDQACFLSRDGQILKIIYDILRQKYPELPPSKYLYASRRAWNVPTIFKFEEGAISFLCSGTSKIPVYNFLKRIGLDPNSFKESVHEVGFPDLNYIVKTDEDYFKLRNLFQNVDVLDAVLTLAREERKILNDYLIQEGIFEMGKIGIIDIGWHGTLQESLSRLLAGHSSAPKLYGYYLGTFPTNNQMIEKGLKCKGYLCNEGHPKYLYQLIKKCVEIFELILYGDHGPVLNFTMNSDLIVPIMNPIEISPAQLKVVKEIRRGLIEFMTDCLKYNFNMLDLLNSHSYVSISRLERLLLLPNREAASKIGDLDHVEGFGTGDGSRRKIAALPSLKQILLHPRILLEIRDQNFWEPGIKRRFPFFIDYLSQKNIIKLDKIEQLFQKFLNLLK